MQFPSKFLSWSEDSTRILIPYLHHFNFSLPRLIWKDWTFQVWSKHTFLHYVIDFKYVLNQMQAIFHDSRDFDLSHPLDKSPKLTLMETCLILSLIYFLHIFLKTRGHFQKQSSSLFSRIFNREYSMQLPWNIARTKTKFQIRFGLLVTLEIIQPIWNENILISPATLPSTCR